MDSNTPHDNHQETDGRQQLPVFAIVPVGLIAAASKRGAVLAVWCALVVRTRKERRWCFVKHSTIAADAGISVAQVKRSVAWLEETGWLSSKPHKAGERASRGRPVNRYSLHLNNSADMSYSNSSNLNHSNSSNLFSNEPESGSNLSYRSRELPKKVPPKNRKQRGQAEAYSEAFDELWASYPRKEGKKAAARAWKKLTSAEQQRALEAVRVYKQATEDWPDEERKYIPHPATWLNNACYDDDRTLWARKGDNAGTIPDQDSRYGNGKTVPPRRRIDSSVSESLRRPDADTHIPSSLRDAADSGRSEKREDRAAEVRA